MSDQVESVTYTTVLDSDAVSAPEVTTELGVKSDTAGGEDFVASFIKETVADNLDVLIQAQAEKQNRLKCLQDEVLKEKEDLRLIASRVRMAQKTLVDCQLILNSPGIPAKQLYALSRIENAGESLKHLARQIGIKVKNSSSKKPKATKKPKKNSTSK
jgi:septation ring formation regulator EzrA